LIDTNKPIVAIKPICRESVSLLLHPRVKSAIYNVKDRNLVGIVHEDNFVHVASHAKRNTHALAHIGQGPEHLDLFFFSFWRRNF